MVLAVLRRVLKLGIIAAHRVRATWLKSFLKSATNTGPLMMASLMDFEISDLPPPDTVQGLWQSVGSVAAPMSRHARPGGFSILTR